MIMPCMNSTSACDRGGSAALVEGGSALLGFPGAPGCTTTGGGAESVCCACAAEQNKPAATLAARSMPHSKTDALAELSPLLRRKLYISRFASDLNIFNALTLKIPAKRKDAEMRLAPSNHQNPRNLCRIGTGGRSSRSHPDPLTAYYFLCISPSGSIVVDCKSHQVGFTRLPWSAVNSTKLLPAAKLRKRSEGSLVVPS